MKHSLVDREQMLSLDARSGETIELVKYLDIEAILAAARRQWRIVAFSLVFFLFCGAGYLMTATPQYSASASLLIDSNNQKLTDQLSAITGVLTDDSAVLSQVELVRSEKILTAVIEAQHLTQLAYFRSPPRSLLSRLLGAGLGAVREALHLDGATAEPEQSEEDLQDTIRDALAQNLAVERVGRSNVLTLTYTSPNPAMSAQIVKAFADVYLNDQLDARFEATRRAGDWLQDRINELRTKSLTSDLAVQKFKTDNGLLTANGQFINEQKLSQYNTQLLAAQAETTNAEAKLERIEAVILSGRPDAATADTVDSPLITKLREQYLLASRKESEIRNRLGENHLQAIRLRTQMGEYRRSILEELTQIKESYKSDYLVASAKQKALEAKVASASTATSSANDSQVQLRELQREADTYRTLYQQFMGRYQEAVQQQTFPVTDARIISRPSIPKKPSAPKKTVVMAMFVVLGIGFGIVIGGIREFRDRFFRNGSQVRDMLGVPFIGALEEINLKKARVSAPPYTGGKLIRQTEGKTRYAITHPLSAFAETLRSAKIAIDVAVGDKTPKIIGVVSALADEGKSTLSVNLAQLLAKQNARVLLIDADIRKPGATNQLAPRAERGILDALENPASVHTAYVHDAETGLSFLPAIVKQRIPHSADLLSGAQMDQLIQEFTGNFDYVIIDLPPLDVVVDARAIASKLDTFILAIAWGRTLHNTVRRTLSLNPAVASICCGAILTRVDAKKMMLYSEDGPQYGGNYHGYYTS
jgi:succinoglycan biosynthesis transport protein ExoP